MFWCRRRRCKLLSDWTLAPRNLPLCPGNNQKYKTTQKQFSVCFVSPTVQSQNTSYHYQIRQRTAESHHISVDQQIHKLLQFHVQQTCHFLLDIYLPAKHTNRHIKTDRQVFTSCFSSCSASVLVMFLQYHLQRDERNMTNDLTFAFYDVKQLLNTFLQDVVIKQTNVKSNKLQQKTHEFASILFFSVT